MPRNKKVVTGKNRLWSDPVARVLAALIVLVVIGGLMTFISMLVTGVLPLSFVPLTSEEADIEQYQYVVDTNQDPDSWSKLIVVLSRSGKTKEARKQLEAFAATQPDVVATQGVAYAEAQLLIAEKKYDEALTVLAQVRQDLWDAYEYELSTDKDKNWAISGGIPNNYLQATLDMADIYIMQNKDGDALKMLDDYLSKLSTDGSAFVTRARVKMRMGDLEGAEADLLSAQRVLPDEEEIAKGLEEIKAMR